MNILFENFLDEGIFPPVNLCSPNGERETMEKTLNFVLSSLSRLQGSFCGNFMSVKFEKGDDFK